MLIQTEPIIVSKNRKIAITGAFSALVILMGVPGLHLGYIQLNPTVSLTIMHIPIVLATVLSGLPGAIVTSLIFGLTSLVNAAINPTGMLDPLFLNPLCSVLPRLLFGVFAWFLFNALSSIPKMPKPISATVTAFVASIFHTIVVIGSLYLFLNEKITAAMGGQGYIPVMIVILPGAVLEAVAATIITLAITTTIFIGQHRHAKIFDEKTE